LVELLWEYVGIPQNSTLRDWREIPGRRGVSLPLDRRLSPIVRTLIRNSCSIKNSRISLKTKEKTIFYPKHKCTSAYLCISRAALDTLAQHK